uniref:Uncharacterized protein n=1 Tax=Glossina austeni TaxID=7395 RepID=A0A1A9VCC0_GLOAU
MSSNVILPECLKFFCFLLSRCDSFKAFVIKETAEGTTDMLTCLFCIVKQTVILSLFQSEVALAISSPTFLADKSNGPIFGVIEEVAPTSLSTQRKYTNFSSAGSNFDCDDLLEILNGSVLKVIFASDFNITTILERPN